MAEFPALPLFTDAYLADTRHLSTVQHGAYLLLLMDMWNRDGVLPDNPKALARIAGLSTKRWPGVWGSICHLFLIEDGVIRHKRVDYELLKAEEISEKRRAAGEAGNRAKALKRQDSDDAFAPQTDYACERRPPPPEPPLVDGGVVGGEIDFDALETSCRKWANGSLNLVEYAAHDLSPITRLLKPPGGGIACNLDDVRNGISKVAAGLHAKGEQVGTLKYFTKAIIRERDLRLTPLPEPEKINERAGQNPSRSGTGGHADRGVRARPGREQRSATFDTALAELFSGGETQAEFSNGPDDGGIQRVA